MCEETISALERMYRDLRAVVSPLAPGLVQLRPFQIDALTGRERKPEAREGHEFPVCLGTDGQEHAEF